MAAATADFISVAHYWRGRSGSVWRHRQPSPSSSLVPWDIQKVREGAGTGAWPEHSFFSFLLEKVLGLGLNTLSSPFLSDTLNMYGPVKDQLDSQCASSKQEERRQNHNEYDESPDDQ